MKRILLSLFLLLTAVVSQAHDFEVDGIYYNITSAEEHTVAVTFRGDSYTQDSDWYFDDVVIPKSVIYDGVTYHVTAIGDYAFYYCTTLTSITISDSVIDIGRYAFSGCTALTSITIPNSVTRVGSFTFYGCSGLTSITIPDSVVEIGGGAFYGCSGLTSITIPNSVVEIGGSAFEGCSGLSSIAIPNGVTTINRSTFLDCSGLTSITIPYSVTEIGGSAFYGCSGLTSITIPNSVVEIGGSAFQGCSGLTSITIPNGVTAIKKSTFQGCSGLTSITIPNSVTTIREYAFSGCTSLTSITIPNSVVEIGGSAFKDCTALTSVTFDNNTIKMEDYAFLDCSALTTITFGSGVTEIGGGRSIFNGCRALKDVYCLAESVPSTDEAIFLGVSIVPSSFLILHVPAASLQSYSTTSPWSNFGQILGDSDAIEQLSFEVDSICYYITSAEDFTVTVASRNMCSGNIVIPESVTYDGVTYSVTEIAPFAFYDCTELTSITLPNSVTRINKDAFHGCSGLTSITIPNSVTEISSSTFYGCTSLESIVVADDNPVYDSRDNCNAIIETSSNTLICGCKNTVIPSSVTKIGTSAFKGCSSLLFITIPNSVAEIGEAAFYGCNVLDDIYCFAENIPIMGNNVFSNLLGTLHLPAELLQVYSTTAPWNRFRKTVVMGATGDVFFADGICYSITSAEELTVGVRKNGYGMVNRYSGGDVIIPESVTYVGKTYSVTSIENKAFENCTALSSVVIPSSVTTIGGNAFSTCTTLSSVNIPNSVTYIGQYAFSGTALTSLTIGQPSSSIPVGEIEIEKNAFYSCSALTDVTFNNSVITIKGYAFDRCSALKTIVFGSNVTTICGEMYAFNTRAKLKDFYCWAENVPTVDNDVFSMMSPPASSLTLHVPAASLEAYSTADVWQNFGQIVAIEEEDGIEQLTPDAFMNPTLYDLNGRRTAAMQKGINLLRSADGRVKKVLRK